MAWNVITLSDGSTRWADEETAAGYLDQVLSITDDKSEAFSRLVQQGTNDEQHNAVAKAWGFLGTVYKCLNVAPQTDAAYLSQFARAYGFEENSFANVDLFFQRRGMENLSVVSNTTSETGWMVRSAASLVFRDAASRAYARSNKIDYVIRIWLTKFGDARVSCFETPYARTCVNAASEPWYEVTGKPQLFGINIDNKECKDAYDWKCVQSFGNKVVFPALIWSMGLAHAIAASIQTNGTRATMETSFRRADVLRRPALVYDGKPDVLIPPVSSQGAAATSPGQSTGPAVTVTPVGQAPMGTGSGPVVTPIGQSPMGGMTQPTQVVPIGQSPMGPTMPPRIVPIGQVPVSGNTPISMPPTTPTNPTPTQPTSGQGTATQGTPMATNNTQGQTLTLADMGVSCERWIAMDDDQKRMAVQSAFLQKYNIQIQTESVSVIAASINATCRTAATSPNQGSAPGATPGNTNGNGNGASPGTGATPRPLPATLGEIFAELRTDCVTWLRNDTTAKVNLIRQAIFTPRGLQATNVDIQKLVATLDACASAVVTTPTQPTKPSWWNGSGPLLVGGALLGGVMWYAFSQKKMDENVLDTAGLLGPLEPEPTASAPAAVSTPEEPQTQTFTDTVAESFTVSSSGDAPTLTEEIFGG